MCIRDRGAYGVALLSKEQFEANLDMEYTSTILKADKLDTLDIKTTQVRCGKCENNCLLTINKFNNGKTFISGKRCEKGSGNVTENANLPNIDVYKRQKEALMLIIIVGII